MAAYTDLSVDDVELIVRAYSLVGVSALEAVRGGTVNSNYLVTAGGVDLFLRVYEESDLEGARYEARLAAHLAAHGVPTPVPLRTRSGGFATEHAGKAVALFPRVGGEEVCQARVSQAKAGRVGRLIAEVHAAGADFPDRRAGRFTLADVAVRLASARPSEGSDLAAAVERIREEVARASEERAKGLPSGTIHGDLFRDNVRWEGDDVVAVLDFESASHGPFAYDLAVGILSWCYADHFVPGLVRAVIRGYESVRPLSAEERVALASEARVACTRFATTRITDIELRSPNGRTSGKDYRRFLARMDEVEEAVRAAFG